MQYRIHLKCNQYTKDNVIGSKYWESGLCIELLFYGFSKNILH